MGITCYMDAAKLTATPHVLLANLNILLKIIVLSTDFKYIFLSIYFYKKKKVRFNTEKLKL